MLTAVRAGGMGVSAFCRPALSVPLVEDTAIVSLMEPACVAAVSVTVVSTFSVSCATEGTVLLPVAHRISPSIPTVLQKRAR